MNKEKKEKRVKENEKEKEKENICKCLMSAAENAWSWVPPIIQMEEGMNNLRVSFVGCEYL